MQLPFRVTRGNLRQPKVIRKFFFITMICLYFTIAVALCVVFSKLNPALSSCWWLSLHQTSVCLTLCFPRPPFLNPISWSRGKANPLPPSSQCPLLPVCRDELRLSSELLQWRKHAQTPLSGKTTASFQASRFIIVIMAFVISGVKVQDTKRWPRVAQCEHTCTAILCTSLLFLFTAVCQRVEHTTNIMYVPWHYALISSLYA